MNTFPLPHHQTSRLHAGGVTPGLGSINRRSEESGQSLSTSQVGCEVIKYRRMRGMEMTGVASWEVILFANAQLDVYCSQPSHGHQETFHAKPEQEIHVGRSKFADTSGKSNKTQSHLRLNAVRHCWI